jgi:hypothetical protein
VGEQLRALQECIKERETIAASIAVASRENSVESNTQNDPGVDPTIFQSQAKGPDLHVHMSEQDTLNDDIRNGYVNDKLFQKVLEKPEDHPGFKIWDDFIWMKNRGGEDVLCVPILTSKNMTLHSRIIEQAHSM